MRRQVACAVPADPDKMDKSIDKLDILYQKYNILTDAGDNIAQVCHWVDE
jgi:hypothetical protein